MMTNLLGMSGNPRESKLGRRLRLAAATSTLLLLCQCGAGTEGDASSITGDGPVGESASALTFSVTSLDPVTSTAAKFGTGAASAGDVNGDGYDDIIVGAPGDASFYVFMGSAAGISTSPALVVSEPGSGLGGVALGIGGPPVAGIGDVNSDGYDDIAVGARLAASGGRVDIYLGSSSGLPGAASFSLSAPPGSTSGFGYSVAGARDVNADGYDDLLVSDTSTILPYSYGTVFLFLGQDSGVAALPACTVPMPTYYYPGFVLNGVWGSSMAGVGDTNGDGYDDVVIGSYSSLYMDYSTTPPSFGGSAPVQVIQGTPTGLAATPSMDVLYGLLAGDGISANVAGLGDVNGDGFADIAVGDLDLQYLDGNVDVFLGSAAGINTTAATHLAGPFNYPYSSGFGGAVAGPGDVDGDGLDDLLVGEMYLETSPGVFEGAAHLYPGTASGVGTSPIWSDSPTAQNNSYFGWYAARAGDVNGDGAPDFVVGAPEFDGASTNSGRAYVYYTPSSTSPCDGNNTDNAFSDNTSMGGPMVGIEWTPASTLTLDRIEVFTGEIAASNQLAIWTDDGGSPSQPLAPLGTTAAFTTSLTNGWQGADFTAPVTLVGGTKYWVVWDPAGGEQASVTPDPSGTQQNYWGSFSGTVNGGAAWFGPFNDSSDKWKFRVFCAAGPCAGDNYNNDNFSDNTSMGGPMVGIEWTPTASATLGRIEVYTGEVVAPNQLAIWSDNGGSPSQPLATLGATAVFNTSLANGWQGADFTAPVSVTAGTKYWVVWDPSGGEQASVTPDVSASQQNYWGSFSGNVNGGASWFGPFNDASDKWKFRMFCGTGGGCGPDGDGDGVCDATDNCPTIWNPSQADSDSDNVGDACELTCTTFVRTFGPPNGVFDAQISFDPGDPTVAVANYGTATLMGVGSVGARTNQSLVKADLSSLPTTAVIQSANLSLRKATGVGPNIMNALRVTANWSETTVTWSTFGGAYDGSTVWASAQPSLTPVGSNVVLDVTALVQQWVSGALPNEGLLLDQPGGSRSVYGTSNSSTTNRPKLDVCYMPGE